MAAAVIKAADKAADTMRYAADKARSDDKRRKSIDRLIPLEEQPDIIETAVDFDVKNFCSGYDTDTIFITCGCCGQELGGSDFAKEQLTVDELSILETSLDKWVDFLSSCNTDAQFTRALIENVPNGALRGCQDFCLYYFYFYFYYYNYYNYYYYYYYIVLKVPRLFSDPHHPHLY